MNLKEKTMRQEARERIIECLKDGFEGHYCDLHNEVFNTDYYIIGTYEAKKALEEYGVFDAIGKVQTYEKEYYGRIYTNFSNPEEIVNMLFYIIGEEVLYDMLSESETLEKGYEGITIADEETNTKILRELGELGE